jgi:MFS family permease
MFERFRNRSEETNGDGGRTAVAERPVEEREGATRGRDEEAATRRHTPATRTTADGGAAVGTREHMRTARARQREEYGGINWGAAFFGWLVAVGLGSLLVAILAAAGAAVGLTQNVTTTDATTNAETIGLGGAIALIVVLMIAYYCGGYVAGRMSRFDGARQGFGAWIFGVVVTLLLAAAAAILGSEYNVLDQLNLPALPVGSDTMTTGAVIALIAVVAASLLAAIVGGKAGERYHRKVDRAGFVD